MSDSSAPASPGFWATVRESLRGTEQDLTKIATSRAVVLLAVPMVLEMSMESLFAVVDMLFVSKIGSDAVATIGLTESLLSLMYAMAMGLSAGATAIIARRTGEKDPDGAAVAAVQVVLLSTVLSLAIGALGVALSPRLLALMGASASIVESGSRYAAIMLGGSASIFLLFVINAIFRGVGDAAMAMRSLWIASLLNVVLGPCLIFGLGPFPRMGVTGAAIATTISRSAGVLFQLAMLSRGSERLTIKREHMRVDLPVIREIGRIATGAALQTLVETASWLGLVRILATYGSAALAGYTIAMRVVIFAMLPAFGLANAAATLVGQNLGAKEPDRAEQSVRTVARYNVAVLGLASLAFIAAPSLFVHIFTVDAPSAAYAVQCLRTVAVGFAFFGYGMVVVQAYNGAGDSTTPMLVNVLCFWLCKIPVAYLLAKVAGLGPQGVFIAITIAYSMQALVGGFLFRRGRWKQLQIAAT